MWPDGSVGMIWVSYAEIMPLREQGNFEYGMRLVNERRRAKVLRCKSESDQCRTLAAGLLLKRALENAGIDYETAVFEEREGGKPSLVMPDAPFFNLSHGAELAACVLADQPVGIDVEQIVRFEEKRRWDRVARRAFSQDELLTVSGGTNPAEQFARIWTRKESYAKAVGKGLGMEFKQTDTLQDAIFATRELIPGYQCSICCPAEKNGKWKEEIDIQEVSYAR